ncbi:response regulator [Cohnella silvisoli]|uniref:histidine kinase n=1 Tax=Cohnella silvisoli TaxID=2873699 RepID=A0ABV1KXY6_9BACL|nr:response regulator [Cohnella silvisoli]MCD9021856.1 response regulator [Cohnella silvisoli]
MFRSLRFKIVVVLVLINIISFTAMSLINLEISNKQMNKQLVTHSLTNLKNTIANLNTMLSLRMKEAELMSRSIPLRLKSLGEQLVYLKLETPSSNLIALHIGIADRNGTMKLTDNSTLPVDHMEAYQSALRGISAYADPELDSDGNPVLWLMVPQYNSINGVEGVIGFALDSYRMFNDPLSVEQNGYKDSAIVLIDWDMNLLHYKDRSLILKRNYIKDVPSLLDFANQIRTSEEGFGEAPVFTRVLKMFYVRIPGHDWYAVFSVAKKEFEAPLQRALWINMALIALTEMILGSILYILAERSILGRLKQVVAVTQKVAAGNFYTQPLRIKSKDEMGLLSSSINGMIDNLQDLFEPFQAFIRHNQYAMIVTDSRFVITSYNKRAEEMLGYGENEVVGRKSLLLWHDREQLQERANFYTVKLNRQINPDETVLFVLSHQGFLPDWEWTWINREGSRMLVSLNPSVMRHPDGTIKGYVLIARDISDIKKAVETNTRLLEIIESAHDMIASFDMRGRIFYLNRAGHAFLGIGALNEQNNRLSHYMPIPTTVRFADGLTEAQKHGFWQNEIEFIGADGDVQMASINVVAHVTEDGKDSFFSTIVRDISDQKEIQRQLVRAKDEADEANEAKSSFLARMSHEIRTPLNGIIGLSYLLQRSELTEIQEDYIRQVSDSSQNLLRILNDILDFSKLEADKLALEQVPFRLEESMQRLSGIFAVLLGPKPVDFILNVDPLIPAWLIGDPTRLEQVLLNLGSNAIKFTNYGLIEMSISLTSISNGQASLKFCVQDSGIGMTEQQRAQLFMPFVQADEKTSRKYGGTGLGLVISHTLVERMGGHIGVESTYLVGSTFTFELTLQVDDNKTVTGTNKNLDLNILVLEDHPQVADYWRKLLISMGCDVAALSEWKQAQPLLLQQKWDLFIVDMEAGDMHGEETWAVWKTELDAQGIQVISSTTLLGRDALQHLSDNLKPAAVLVKPASALQVLQALQVISNHVHYSSLQENDAIYPRTPGEDPLLNKLRILVVDDQVINRLVAKQLLEQQGFEVATVENGLEALLVLEQSTMDLVLMDLHMPDMDGCEVTRLIRKRFNMKELPIIALTADVTEEQHYKCLAAGMNDIITKPIQPDLLFSTLSRWLPSTQSSPAVNAEKDEESWPDTPGLNVPLALLRLDGKSGLYLKLLDKFLQQYSDTESRLHRFLKDGDRDNAIRLVHSLSGTAGHLGAVGIQQSAATAERILHEHGSLTEMLEELGVELRQTFETIQNLLLQKRS